MIQNINLPEVKEDIVKRLEKLNKWQEEQKKLLHERQNMQRQMLGLEQRKMYENLGILEPEDEDETEYSIQCPRKTNDDECSMSAHDDELSEDEDYTEATNTCTETKRTSGYCTEDVQNSASPTLKPKKPFLRRGEGLKQRFKIDPDALRLNNLPHYKYANAHPHLNNNNSTNKPSKKVMKPTTKVKVNKTKSIDSQEKRFQQMLISSENLCNSTPDVKSTSAASMQSLLPKVRFVDNEVNIKTSNIRLNKEQEDSSCGTEFTSPQPVSWAKVLDSQQIKPLPVQTFRYTPDVPERQGPDPDENLSIFEMLEQKANEGSIDLNSTPIRQFMLKKIEKVEDNDEIPVANRLHTAGILPKVAEIDENLNESEEDGEDGVSTIFDTEYDDTTITPDKPTRNKSRIKVRFSEENETQEYEEGSETSNAAVDESSSLYMFQQFKQALFSALQPKGNDSNCTMTTTNADELSGQWLGRSENSVLTEDLQLKMNLIKTRLAELEKEISTFKENNVHLIKAKQAHELEKAHFAQEQLEAMDKLNDEKIQMEIYFHDERMNIEDEKRKLERQIQMHKTSANSKDRKEIARLKNEIEEMQAQIKQKEQMHVAAQARLRAQIRTLEKDQKQLYDDIERLTKENKRLQNENLKISRENNNKMLQEINRNIAKLAPKLSSAPIDEERTRPVKESTKVSSKPKADKRPILHKSKPKAKVTHDALSLSECENRASELISCFDGDYDENEEDALELSKEIKGVQSNLKNVQFADSLKKSKPTSETNVNDTTNELKREIINSDGSKDIWYPNGNLKKISADEMIIRMLYFNKDIKETNINEGTVKYYYAESNTWHTTYLDGLEILEFPNGQTEHRYKNGIVEVHFPNNSIKVTNPADEHKLEEWRFADGTNLIHMRNGDKILMLPDGQKEIHTKLNKRREYPDGTVKLVYPDGSQETRYSNGRVRLKDKDGKLVMDSEHAT